MTIGRSMNGEEHPWETSPSHPPSHPSSHPPSFSTAHSSLSTSFDYTPSPAPIASGTRTWCMQCLMPIMALLSETAVYRIGMGGMGEELVGVGVGVGVGLASGSVISILAARTLWLVSVWMYQFFDTDALLLYPSPSQPAPSHHPPNPSYTVHASDEASVNMHIMQAVLRFILDMLGSSTPLPTPGTSGTRSTTCVAADMYVRLHAKQALQAFLSHTGHGYSL